MKGLKPNVVDAVVGLTVHGLRVDRSSVNDGSPISYEFGLSRKEFLPTGGSKIHPTGPNAAAKKMGMG